MSSDPVPYCYLFLHESLSARSGMLPMVEAVGGVPVYYSIFWQEIRQKSWRLGELCRRAGIRCAGTEWNATVPLLGELNFARNIPRDARAVAHYIYADFTLPSMKSLYRRRNIPQVATFHASLRKLEQIFHRKGLFDACDSLVLMSRTQVPYFLEQGVPEEKLNVILHGVDAEYFHPDETERKPEDVLKAFIVGKTERDHEFTAEVMRALPEGVMTLYVATNLRQKKVYRDVPNVEILDWLSDEDLVRMYQGSDLLFMPMHDCTANNAVLESMACGTPVLINDIGGAREYVGEKGGMILPDKKVSDWVDFIKDLSASRRAEWDAMRPGVREWAEANDWKLRAEAYREVYRYVCCTES